MASTQITPAHISEVRQPRVLAINDGNRLPLHVQREAHDIVLRREDGMHRIMLTPAEAAALISALKELLDV